jgi:hypothetical protein
VSRDMGRAELLYGEETSEGLHLHTSAALKKARHSS